MIRFAHTRPTSGFIGGPSRRRVLQWTRERYVSTKPSADAKAQSDGPRVDRVISRRKNSSPAPVLSASTFADTRFHTVPKFLRGYVDPLRRAPVTHVSSFLLLHELTAIVPLFGLAAMFHYAQWMPPFISEGKWVSDGVEMFGRYFRKKGWLGEEKQRRYKWWGRGEGGVRIVTE